jgi:hypothetical protein
MDSDPDPAIFVIDYWISDSLKSIGSQLYILARKINFLNVRGPIPKISWKVLFKKVENPLPITAV